MGETSEVIYLSPYSLLAMARTGNLIRIHCPFTVEAISETYGLFPGRRYEVNLVRDDPLLLMLYRIGELYYPYSAFRITVAGDD